MKRDKEEVYELRERRDPRWRSRAYVQLLGGTKKKKMSCFACFKPEKKKMPSRKVESREEVAVVKKVSSLKEAPPRESGK